MLPIKKEKEQSEYSTFGRNEFRNAHTGEMQKSVTINWSPLNYAYAPTTTKTIHDDYTMIINKLPDIIHLSNFKGGNRYEHEIPFFQDNIKKEELYQVSYGTLLAINKYVNEGSV